MADFDSVTLAEALGAGIAAFAGKCGLHGGAGKAGKFGLRLKESESEAEHVVTAEERLEALTAQAEDNRIRVARELAADTSAEPILQVTFEAESVQAEGTASDAPSEDQFWADARARMGLQEAHKNALYLTATLLHVDRPNSNGDIVPRAEAEAALPSLVGQPVDVSPGMDQHERERLYGMNGIRGFVYAARIAAEAIEIGAVLWAYDFPDIAEGLVDFRDSLGASFDLVAKGADYTNVGDPDQQTERSLRGITFLGGAILAKNRAADSTTKIGNVRYGGKPIEQIEEEQRMAEQAKTDKEATAQATVETPAVETVSPVETALAASQAEVKALAAKLETASAAAAVAEEKLAQASAALAEVQAKADEAQAKLDAQAEAEARTERITARMEALDAMAAEIKRTLAEGEEARTAMAEAVAGLSDSEFETFKLKKELELLKTTAAKAETPAPEVQATAGARAGAGVFGVLNAGGAGLADSKPAEIGRRFVEASTRRKAE